MNQHNSNSNDTDKDTGSDAQSQLDAAVWAIVSTSIDSQAVDRVKERAVALAVDPAVKRTRPSRGKRASKWRWLQVATLAASVLIIVGGVMSLNSTSTSSAFAAVIKQLKATGAFSYTSVVYTEIQKEPLVSKEMFSEDGRQRSEWPEMIALSDRNGRPRLTLDKQFKLAMVDEGGDWPDREFRQGEWINSLKSLAKPDGSLGIKQIDGRDCEGFAILPENSEISIWVAVDTSELIQVETLMKHSSATKVVMKDFKFNQTFDESLFRFDVPKGYTVDTMTEADIANLPTGEESMVGALRAYTELTDGKFPKKPADLDGWASWMSPELDSGMSLLESIGQAFWDEFTGRQRNVEVEQELTEHVIFVTSFVAQMSKDDYGYTGEGVTTDDPRTIVFWYRAEEGKFRAIYNDFSITDIDELDLSRE